jgi:hypothetical protein
VIVELDVFSGRENPQWSLDPDAEARVGELLERLGPPGAPPEPPGLGYRGFVVSGSAGVYRVYRGHVLTPGGHRSDPARALEGLLLSTLPREFDALRATVEAEIRP